VGSRIVILEAIHRFFDNTRTKELFLRWAEMAMFTPFMRTHEGNRPDTNFQYYDDEDTMERLDETR